MNEALWWITKDGDEVCRALYDKHYSKRTYRDGRKPKLFVGPGEKLVLRTWECDALWAWRKFRDDSGQTGINCAIFRNESRYQSSELIRQADAIADLCWPGERHYTYVNAAKIKSVNPGYCFKRAGWSECGRTKGGIVILELKRDCQSETPPDKTDCAERDAKDKQIAELRKRAEEAENEVAFMKVSESNELAATKMKLARAEREYILLHAEAKTKFAGTNHPRRRSSYRGVCLEGDRDDEGGEMILAVLNIGGFVKHIVIDEAQRREGTLRVPVPASLASLPCGLESVPSPLSPPRILNFRLAHYDAENRISYWEASL